MDLPSRKKRNPNRRTPINKPLITILFFTSLVFLSLITLSLLKIPKFDSSIRSHHQIKQEYHSIESSSTSRFGHMMLEMLPLDLSFTVFIPTETSFKRDLGLEWNESSTIEEKDNVVAIVSRVLGFSSVARKVRADSVVIGELVEYESVSGFRVGVYRGLDGVLVVNGVRVVEMDLEVGEVVVHLIDGVVMDAAFEQSVRPDNDDGVGDDDGKEE